jgi:hypothetical protein
LELFGLSRKDSLQSANAACNCPNARPQPAAAVKRVGIIGVEPDRLAVILDRAFVVALSLVSDASAVESIGVVRVELDGLIVVPDCAIRVTLRNEGAAAVLEGNGKTIFRQTAGFNQACTAIDPKINRSVGIGAEACVPRCAVAAMGAAATNDKLNSNVPRAPNPLRIIPPPKMLARAS